VAQYAGPVATEFGDLARVPDEYLLWFHHVPWDYRMRSGRTLWDELVHRYTHGVDEVKRMRRTWGGLSAYVDQQRYDETAAFLGIQQREAQWWRDACIAYFQSIARRPLPAGVEPPAHTLKYYESLSFPYAPGQAK
jgi:alpha-glucuronidase